MQIQYQYYPKNSCVPDFLNDIISIFMVREELIMSSKFQLLSDEVLHIISGDISLLGYEVERGKKSGEKIQVPVLFGRNGTLEKYFEVDCYNPINKVVIEVEAGRAVSNYQFLKDIFQACVMHNVDYLVIAVRNIYRTQKDFDKVINFMDTLYASDKLQLPLKGILIIGY